MHSTQLEHHISTQFDLELEDIRDKTLALGGLVEQQFKDAAQTLITGNGAPAHHTAPRLTKQIEDEQIAINKACTAILARRQPAAFDLKLLIVIIKTVSELARISNTAEHIASKALHCCTVEKKSHTHHEVEHIYDLAKQTLHHALEALAHFRIERAAQQATLGDEIAHAYDTLFRQMTAYMLENPQNIKHLMNVLYAAREIERIAENARHIHKNVATLVDNPSDPETGNGLRSALLR